MKGSNRLPSARATFRLFVLALTLLPTAQFGRTAQGQATAQLELERTIPLPNVRGRIDHLAVDVPHQRLFVAELGNGSVDAVDLSSGQTRRIGGLKEPQGIAYLSDRNELVVASGGDGTVGFFDAGSLAPVSSISLGDDADNVRVDPKTGEVVVGYGTGALAVIDPTRHSLIRSIRLPAHPEGFQIAPDRRAYVNLPDAHSIAVVDLEGGHVSATWAALHGANFPMSLNQSSGAIAVVYRSPADLVISDASSGALRRDLHTCDDADDLFFDDKRHRIYVSCGGGKIDIFEQTASDYSLAGHLTTRPGARTSLFVPPLDRLYVAARAGLMGSNAALLVYRPEP